MIDLYLDILDSERKEILPILSEFKGDFYLAGGTGLALQIGHRDSIDFDFFCKQSFSTEELTRQLRNIFSNHAVSVIQEEKDTLSVLIEDRIKLSFFSYPYDLVKPLLDSEFFRLASLEDIGCMKLSAITSRSLLKDYVDLYFILKAIPLKHLLDLSTIKFPKINTALILKSLTYFGDITQEPILYKHKHAVSLDRKSVV